MKQFALTEPTPALLVNVNPRREKHGTTKVPAIDLRLEVTAPNTILDQLKGRELRDMLYTSRADGHSPEQGELEGVEDASDTPLLRVQGLQPIRLDDELTGYTVTFDIGTGRKDSIVELDGCKLKSFTIEALQGGSVRVGFTVQAAGLDEKRFGKLSMLIDCEVSLLMEPPDEKAQASMPVGALAGDGDGVSVRH